MHSLWPAEYHYMANRMPKLFPAICRPIPLNTYSITHLHITQLCEEAERNFPIFIQLHHILRRFIAGGLTHPPQFTLTSDLTGSSW